MNGSSQIGAAVTCLTFDGLGKLLWAGDDRVIDSRHLSDGQSVIIVEILPLSAIQGYVVSFMVDPATGRLSKGRRLEIQPSARCRGPLVTSVSFTAWAGRGGRDPSLLVSCTANAVFLYKYVHVIDD